ncbi:MAG: fumarate hydratase, partial [Candidatus Omnitrophota bacterium]
MRVITAKKITDLVAKLCVQANLVLRKDTLSHLKSAYSKETRKSAKEFLSAIIKNAEIASLKKIAICQDTGLASVFVEIGQDVRIAGSIKQAINKGVEIGYKKGYLRNSVIRDPLSRKKAGYSPAIIHFDINRGKKIKITVFPKGFGCENKTQLKMFPPTARIKEIKEFIINAVKAAGADACPPYTIGVGIGGTADYAVFLAKKALLGSVVRRPSSAVRKLGNDLLKEINKLNIGPMGLGGKTTALAINIETYPTHIAGMPVAVNISCHALRSA